LLSLLGLTVGGFVAALTDRDAVMAVATESIRLIAGFVPAALLLGMTKGRPLQKYRQLLRVFVIGVVVHACAAVFQYLGILPSTYFQFGQPRPSGLYFHPVSLGILINVALLLVLLANARRWVRLPTAVALVIALVALSVISTHRAGLVVTLFILISWPLVRFLSESNVRVNTKWSIGIGVVGALLLGVLAVVPQLRVATVSAVQGVVGILSVEDFDPTTESFLRGRGQRWSGAIGLIEDAPVAQRMVGYGWQVVDPHSDYLRALLVHGVVGSALLLLGSIAIAFGFAARSDRFGRLFVGLIVLCTLVYAITTKPTTYTFYMWAVTALAWLAMESAAIKPETPSP
jgi:O-antigen ligase